MLYEEGKWRALPFIGPGLSAGTLSSWNGPSLTDRRRPSGTSAGLFLLLEQHPVKNPRLLWQDGWVVGGGLKHWRPEADEEFNTG